MDISESIHRESRMVSFPADRYGGFEAVPFQRRPQSPKIKESDDFEVPKNGKKEFIGLGNPFVSSGSKRKQSPSPAGLFGFGLSSGCFRRSKFQEAPTTQETDKNKEKTVATRRPALDNFRPRIVKEKLTEYDPICVVGPVKTVILLVPDSQTNQAITYVNMNGWNLISTYTTKQEIGAMYASLLGVYSQDLMNSITFAVEESGAVLYQINLPSQAGQFNLTLSMDEFDEGFSHIENLVYFGLLLLLPFKNISDKNYENFVKARMSAMAGCLGMSEDQIGDLYFPIDLKRAKLIKQVYSGQMEVKRKILEFVMWGTNQKTIIASLCQYVHDILSWGDMNLMVFIHNTFVLTNSPVMLDPSLVEETRCFCTAMAFVLCSENPQFFRYFCDADQERLLQRHNFQILGSVALEIMKRKSKSKTIVNFAGTMIPGSNAQIQELVKLHEDYIGSMMLKDDDPRMKIRKKITTRSSKNLRKMPTVVRRKGYKPRPELV